MAVDKRYEENRRVKQEIAKAFFELLRKKKAEEISVTEITNKAKVSRMAYYRNFSSKLEIIDYYLDETVWHDMRSDLGEEIDFWEPEYGLAFFRVMKKYRNLIMLLDECGYTSTILNAFNNRNEELLGDMPANSIERYRLYYAAGASFNGAMEWIRGGCKESVEDMERNLRGFINSAQG